jgi:hypothetical protein
MCCGEALRGRVAWAHDWISDPSLTPLFQTLLELDRQRRHTGAERRAGRSRRGASARQRRHAPRQIRRRVRLALIELRRIGNVPIPVMRAPAHHVQCPGWVKLGPKVGFVGRPLWPQNQTSQRPARMSQKCQ